MKCRTFEKALEVSPNVRIFILLIRKGSHSTNNAILTMHDAMLIPLMDTETIKNDLTFNQFSIEKCRTINFLY